LAHKTYLVMVQTRYNRINKEAMSLNSPTQNSRNYKKAMTLVRKTQRIHLISSIIWRKFYLV
jgi:hypothetical protein